jgi:hypothetical protein
MACAPQARSEAGVGHIEGGELVGAEERSGGAGQGVLKGGGGALKGGGGARALAFAAGDSASGLARLPLIALPQRTDQYVCAYISPLKRRCCARLLVCVLRGDSDVSSRCVSPHGKALQGRRSGTRLGAKEGADCITLG